MSTQILLCTCTHAFQDVTYGRGRRVHNFADKALPNGGSGYRCTVCSNAREGVTARSEYVEAET